MGVEENRGSGKKGAVRQKRRGMPRKRRSPCLYLDPMANAIQATEVDGSPAVGREGRQALRGDDFVAGGQPLDSG